MVSQGVTSSMLVLRIIALAASVVTIALMVTNNAKYYIPFFDIALLDVKFQDFMAFRYVVAVAAISAAYGIIQLPFALYYAVKQKRLVRNAFFPNFDFYGDKVISLLLATAIGAGIGVAYEAKKSFETSNFSGSGLDRRTIDILNSKVFKFYDRAIIASSVLALACLCMAIVSVLSSINYSRRR
ncbi:hypothetical protein QN277_012227 [Acacia crassicarpa]|uniref:CASP-like protein n=1 Tax=Acacia crassicarpa TaxID=499986 RepID=A0AAE1TEC1_9FABA|nr:hypothetical protein QN277_012227 [Acacia crassicarpa]